jgi:hypothetical protein
MLDPLGRRIVLSTVLPLSSPSPRQDVIIHYYNGSFGMQAKTFFKDTQKCFSVTGN